MPSSRITLSSLVFGVAFAALCTAAPAFGQNPTIVSGKVVAATGQPLPEVSVSIPELQLGVTTKGDGTFSFAVSAERGAGRTVTLSARLVGYHQGEAQITLTPGPVTHNFELGLNPLQLGVVVVTGQGTTSTTEQLGTARSNVTPVEIQKSNESSIITSLAAKAPGVNVSQSSGQPGVSTYIQLRGLTTLTAGDGQPLIVVDGMPVDNSIQDTPGFAPGKDAAANGGPQVTNRAMDINPDDVENVEILKGAAAGAIYGSRAGQGVILITTKHGHSGQTHYTAKSSTSWDHVSNLPYLQTEFGMGGGGKLFSCGSTPNCSPPGRGASWGGIIPAGTPIYDHADEMFTTGHVIDEALTASGGNDKTTFFLSGAYNLNRGMIVGPNNSYGRTSLRFNGSHQMAPDLRVSADLAFAASNGAMLNSSNNVSSLLLGAWRSPSNFSNLPFLDPANGLPRSTRFENPTAQSYSLSRIYDNPFFVAYEQKNTSNVARTFGDVKADYQPLAWLRVNEQLGADYSNDERLYSLPWTSGGSAGLTGNGNVAPGAVNAGFTKNWSVDQTLSTTATHTFSRNFDGSLTVGNNINIREYNTQASVGNGLTAPQPITLGNTSIAVPPVVFTSDIRLASFFGQAQGTMWHQLTLTAALRDDGASTFGPNKQFALFPKGSVAWNVIRDGENGNNILTSVKLRTAYGESGTQPKPYVLGSTFAAQAFNDGFSTPLPTSSINGQGGLASNPFLPNPNLTTERQKEWEMGTDIAFLRSFGDVSFTYYRETTIGAIFPVSVPSFGGYSTEYENAANLWNHGFEIALNLRPIQTRLLSWDVGVNWARNRSQITSLPKGVQYVDIGGTGGLGITGAAVVGQQAPVYYGDDFVRCGRGVILNGQNIDKVGGECLGAKKGALYIDGSGYAQLDAGNQYVIGDPNRNWIGALHTGIRVQKLSLSALLDVQNGGDSYNGTSMALNYFGTSYDSWYYRQPGRTVKFGQNYLVTSAGAAGEGVGKAVSLDQSWFQNAGGVFSGPNSYAIQHSGFAKLREISVAYTLDMPAIQRVTTFSSIEVRLSGRNLHTWTSYKGIDPETSILGSASPLRGIDYFNIPQDRSYVISFTLNR